MTLIAVGCWVLVVNDAMPAGQRQLAGLPLHLLQQLLAHDVLQNHVPLLTEQRDVVVDGAASRKWNFR